GGDTDLEVVDAEVGRKRLADVLLQLTTNRFFQFDHFAGDGAAHVAAGGQYRPVRVEDVHLVHRHSRDGGGNEMADRLCGGKVAVRFGSYDDRCRGRLAAAAERSAIRHNDMDAGGLDALHALNGARDLALERANA